MRLSSPNFKLIFLLARDRLWNIHKSPLPSFSHYFHRLQNGYQLHYIANKPPHPQQKSLAIFIHGFPDSYALWENILTDSNTNLGDAVYVCVDMPGFGGSDSLPVHDTSVLDALADFIIAIRDAYGDASVYVIAHDWGAVVTNRLAAEAPELADRFILLNGPPADLMAANARRIAETSSKIFKQFRQSPWTNFGCLKKSFKNAQPLLHQVMMSGYMFAFNLPRFMVSYLGTGGNMAFIRGVNAIQFGEKKPRLFNAHALASVLGPSLAECKPSPSAGLDQPAYGRTVIERAKSPGTHFWSMTSYYRDGPASKPWTKSLELLAALQSLNQEAPSRRRSSTSSGSGGGGLLFSPQTKGALQAPATVIWGEKDVALSRQLCLDGISDFLAAGSEVILLPRSGHWTPLEAESVAAAAWLIRAHVCGGEGGGAVRTGGEGSLTTHVFDRFREECPDVYPDARQVVRK